jgi:NADH-quinone oxidoreductase subunit G
MREAGFSGSHSAGYHGPNNAENHTRSTEETAQAINAGEISTLYLLHSDPLLSLPDRRLWEQALAKATTVIAHESVLNETLEEYATVVFPAEAYAEKEGTLVHPDGRIQRLRPAIGRPKGPSGELGSGVRPGWLVIAELAKALDLDLGVLEDSAPDWYAETASSTPASEQLFSTVPFYSGVSLGEIGGEGLHWPTYEQNGATNEAWRSPWEPIKVDVPPPSAVRAKRAGDNGLELQLGTYRSLWSSKEVNASPILQFAKAQQLAEISREDAQELGLSPDDSIEIKTEESSLRTPIKIRHSVPQGVIFLATGTETNSATIFDPRTTVVSVSKVEATVGVGA